jgi:hypothetical protein
MGGSSQRAGSESSLEIQRSTSFKSVADLRTEGLGGGVCWSLQMVNDTPPKRGFFFSL